MAWNVSKSNDVGQDGGSAAQAGRARGWAGSSVAGAPRVSLAEAGAWGAAVGRQGWRKGCACAGL